MPLPALAVFLPGIRAGWRGSSGRRLNAVAGISCFPTKEIDDNFSAWMEQS